jgi:hypothetical protein
VVDKITLSQQCPALKEVCWNFHIDVLPDQDAFELYQSKWDYIDLGRMGEDEKTLVRRLAEKYGNGMVVYKRYREGSFTVDVSKL